MDPRHPRTHTIHPPFDGENLERENTGGPCPVSPSHFINALAVAVILIAIGAALYAANAAAGMPA
jgi:hypothetical protein